MWNPFLLIAWIKRCSWIDGCHLLYHLIVVPTLAQQLDVLFLSSMSLDTVLVCNYPCDPIVHARGHPKYN